MSTKVKYPGFNLLNSILHRLGILFIPYLQIYTLELGKSKNSLWREYNILYSFILISYISNTIFSYILYTKRLV